MRRSLTDVSGRRPSLCRLFSTVAPDTLRDVPGCADRQADPQPGLILPPRHPIHSGRRLRFSEPKLSRNNSTLTWWSRAVNFTPYVPLLLSAHPPTPRTRLPRSVSSACGLKSVLLDQRPSLLNLRQQFLVFVRLIHRYCTAVRLLGDVHTGRTALAFPAVLVLVGSRRLRGLPVLVHEASRRVWGLRLRRTEQGLAISHLLVLSSAS